MKKPKLDIGALFILLLLIGCLLADDHKSKNSYVYIAMIVTAITAAITAMLYVLLT